MNTRNDILTVGLSPLDRELITQGLVNLQHNLVERRERTSGALVNVHAEINNQLGIVRALIRRIQHA